MKLKNYKEETINKIIDFTNQRFIERGINPTIREIAEGIGISKSTVGDYLMYMRSVGLIKFDGIRGIKTQYEIELFENNTVCAKLKPVSGGIARYEEGCVEDWAYYPKFVVGVGEIYYVMAHGDSMLRDGILDGNYVSVRVQDKAEPGEIIVANVSGEEFFARYFPEPEKDRVRLHFDNELYSDMYVKECTVKGVATSVDVDMDNFLEARDALDAKLEELGIQKEK